MGLFQIYFHLYKVTIQQQQIILLALQILIVTFEHFLLKHFLKILLKIFIPIIIKHIISNRILNNSGSSHFKL